MKHYKLNSLFRYWDHLRGARLAPARADVCPADIAPLLADVFLLQHHGGGQLTYRLAGSRLCLMYRRELKGRSFFSHWQEAGLAPLQEAAAAVIKQGRILYAESLGINAQEQTISLEWLFLPLFHEGEGFSRIIGVAAAHEAPYWVGTEAVSSQELLYVSLMSAKEAKEGVLASAYQGVRVHAPRAIADLQERIESQFAPRPLPGFHGQRPFALSGGQASAPNFNVVPFARAKRRVRHLAVFEGGQ